MISKNDLPLRSKNAWRKEMRQRLALITNDDTSRVSRFTTALTAILKARPGLWLAFSATREEPVLPSTVEGVEFAYPVLTPKLASHMKFYSAGREQGRFVTGRFGIREPDLQDAAWHAVEIGAPSIQGPAIRGALIPGLGFDRRLRRIGRGAGYYDRFLEESTYLKVGVAFREQVVDTLPHEPHDVGLDGLVTDHEVIWKVASI